MAEYIERENTIKALKNNVTEMEGYIYFGSNKGVPEDEIEDVINEIPAADVVEVKHGEWIVLAEFADKSICTECSICGEEYTYKKGRIGNFVHNCYAKYNYCPNCGAKMDLKEGAENG